MLKIISVIQKFPNYRGSSVTQQYQVTAFVMVGDQDKVDLPLKIIIYYCRNYDSCESQSKLESNFLI